MAKVIEKEAFYGGEQYLFIGQNPIPLVQTFSLSSNVTSSNSSFLGERDGYPIFDGAFRGQASINTILLSQDIFLPYTGNILVNGFLISNPINKLTENHSFVSGMLTSYVNSYSQEALPSLSASFEVYGNVGKVKESQSDLVSQINQLSYTSTGILEESCFGCAEISFGDITNCPVLGYNISINCPRVPIYPINKRLPSHIFLDDSANIRVNFELERSSFSFFDQFTYPSVQPMENFTITLSDKNGNSFNTYQFNDMMLDGSSIQSNVNGPDTISVSYRKKIA